MLCVKDSNEICGTQAGWQNNFTFRDAHTHAHTLIFIYMNIIRTILSVYTLKHRPPTPCNLLQIVGVLSPSEAAGRRLELARMLPSRDVSLPPDL